MASGASDKSRSVALALAIALGPLGAHRFYVGRTGTGLLMACTLGGLGVWWLYDVITIAAGSYRDVRGRLVERWESEVPELDESRLPPEVAEELQALRAEVSELAERVDFAERLLAHPRNEHLPPR